LDYDRRLDFIHKLTRTNLTCRKSLLELTTYGGTAMWWFVDLGFFSEMENGLESHQRVMDFVLSDVNKRIGVFFDALQMILARLVVRAYIRRPVRRIEKRLPKIVFTAQDIEWRIVIDDETGEPKKSDAFFDSVLKKLAFECQCVGVYPVATSRRLLSRQVIRSMAVLVDKLRNWYVPQRPFKFYLPLDARKTMSAASRYFRSAWSQLEGDQTFRDILASEEKVAGLVRSKIERYFRIAFPHAVQLVEIARQMIDKENPDLILIQNEYGPFERSLVVAAKQRGVPTLAIQHGEISPYHRGYMYSADEISADGSARSPYCPIPDKTAVYGPYHKDLLTKVSAYPENSVVVTGQPRYDRLHHMEKIYSRLSALKEYGISSRHRVVLWATQCHGLSMEENISNFRAVLGAIAGISNTALIIKQHPGEAENYTRMIRDFVRGSKSNVLITSGTSDMYEQLFICDLLIAKHSTTVIEAVALDKPVIILNLMGKEGAEYSVDYVREGIATEVHREEELRPAIEKLLRDDSELSRNRKKFIERHLYKIDGKATERVVRIIRQMVGVAPSNTDVSAA